MENKRPGSSTKKPIVSNQEPITLKKQNIKMTGTVKTQKGASSPVRNSMGVKFMTKSIQLKKSNSKIEPASVGR